MGGTDYEGEGIAGLGVAVAAKTLLEFKNKDINTTSYAIQGVGAMGAAVIRYFSEYGSTLKSFSDPIYGGTWIFSKTPSKELITALSFRDFEMSFVTDSISRLLLSQ